MKKILAILLSLVMVLGLFAGCGAKEAPAETKAPEVQAETPETEAAEASYMDQLIAAAQGKKRNIMIAAHFVVGR